MESVQQLIKEEDQGVLIYEDAPDANFEQLANGDEQSRIVMYIPSNQLINDAGQDYVMLVDDAQNIQQFRIVYVVAETEATNMEQPAAIIPRGSSREFLFH